MNSNSVFSHLLLSLAVVSTSVGCSHSSKPAVTTTASPCGQRSIASAGASCIAAFTGAEKETIALIEKFKTLRDERLKVLVPAISPEGSRGAVAVTLSDYNPEYHGWTWVRDGALVMREISEARAREKNPKEKARLSEMMEAYIDFSRRTQDRAGTKNLGEPRFNFAGEPYTGEWGRPQNDGPASRVLTLAPLTNELANEVAKQSSDAKSRRLLELLYKKEMPTTATSLLKRDLEYIAHHFQEKTSDLWEEKKGHHFYTLMVQRAALLEGASIARKMKDPKAAEFYEKSAGEISKWLETFWEKDKGFVGAARDVNPWRHPQASNLDVAVLLGVIHTNRAQDTFGVMDSRIQATALAAENAFAKIYAINKTTSDANGNRLEPAMGRYPEDVYNGHPDEAQRFNEGHPWVLTTFAMTQYYADVALMMMKSPTVKIDATNLAFFRALAGNEKVDVGTIEKSNPVYKVLVKSAINKSLGFSRRISFHLGETISYPEQLHRETGKIISIPSLTWSDASALSALARLELALEAVTAF
jgi:glucoamylase